MNEFWAVVELMGHVTIAGRLTKPSESMNLFQIDIPEGDIFRSEMFGANAVYRIRAVSEEIARAYSLPAHEIVAYDTPIITREQHESEMIRARERINELDFQIEQLKRRLTTVQSLPEPAARSIPMFGDGDDDDDLRPDDD